jgi:hypothetical protein
MRSEIESPTKRNFLCAYLNEIWEKGWLNHFSNEHILIKAMENRLGDGDIVGKKQLMENNANIHGSYDFGTSFIVNLSQKLQHLSEVFAEKEVVSRSLCKLKKINL